jgi:hypothetical protein
MSEQVFNRRNIAQVLMEELSRLAGRIKENHRRAGQVASGRTLRSITYEVTEDRGTLFGRFPFGTLHASYTAKGGEIESLRLFGDYFGQHSSVAFVERFAVRVGIVVPGARKIHYQVGILMLVGAAGCEKQQQCAYGGFDDLFNHSLAVVKC